MFKCRKEVGSITWFAYKNQFFQVPKASPDPSNVEYVDTSSKTTTSIIYLIDFPTEILEKIFLYLTYKNMGEVRRVSIFKILFTSCVKKK